MNSFKRAWIYVLRQKVRSLILLILMVSVSTFVILGISVDKASIEAAANMRNSVGGSIQLKCDDSEENMTKGKETMYGETYEYNGDYITDDIIKAISNVDGVIDYNSENQGGYWGAGVNFKYLSAQFSTDSLSKYGAPVGYTAVLSSKKSNQFTSGELKLEKGRHITPSDKHVVMISEELAKHNNLSVGDKIKTYSLDSDSISELEIVGVFSGTEGTGEDALTQSQVPSNQGFVDYNTRNENFGREVDGFPSLSIYVDEPKSIQDVYDKIKNLPQIKGKTLKLEIDNEEFNEIANPLESLQDLVRSIIIISAIVSFTILTVILTLWVRNRTKEIGILLSIGKSKGSIIAQFFIEVTIVASISFGISYFISNLLAGKVSEFLIAKIAEATTDIAVRILPTYLIPVYIIGTVIITCAVIIASYSVIRLKPKDILNKMS
nr:ABC transporter permease [Clostridioides difficile]